MLQINGIEVVSMQNISEMSGLSIEALRQRQGRGTLRLEPVDKIHGMHFYRADDVRALVRNGL